MRHDAIEPIAALANSKFALDNVSVTDILILLFLCLLCPFHILCRSSQDRLSQLDALGFAPGYGLPVPVDFINENSLWITTMLLTVWQSTDTEHYATTADILTYLKENGIPCDRKTIPGDIQKLSDIGIDIEEERSRENRYSLSSHLFTLPELKLLIDAVESSKFITSKKSTELIEKLSQMSSTHQAVELRNL